MRVTFLGTGTSHGVPMIGCRCAVCTSTDPRNHRRRASILVEWRETIVVVDTGPEFRLQIIDAHVDRLDAVLLTHYHTDHCADLAALLFALRSPQFAGRRPLDVHGAPGLQRLVDTLTQAWPWLQPRG